MVGQTPVALVERGEADVAALDGRYERSVRHDL
ncbi:hypothetical protein FHS96_000680 [Sphingomonas zeicaulis]